MVAYFLITAVFIGGLYGLYRWWRIRIDQELAEGAAYEYAHLKKHEPEFLEGISETQFSEVFNRAEMPRGPGYALAMISTFLIGSPLALGLLAGGDRLMHVLGIIPSPDAVAARVFFDEEGQSRISADIPPEALQYYVHDLGGFYYFFGMLIFWMIIVWYFMRRFHQRRPGLLRDEIIRAK